MNSREERVQRRGSEAMRSRYVRGRAFPLVSVIGGVEDPATSNPRSLLYGAPGTPHSGMVSALYGANWPNAGAVRTCVRCCIVALCWSTLPSVGHRPPLWVRAVHYQRCLAVG